MLRLPLDVQRVDDVACAGPRDLVPATRRTEAPLRLERPAIGFEVVAVTQRARGRGQVWCWLDGSTPWYAGQRICRQERAGCWEPAIQRAAAVLDERFASS